MDDDQKNKPKRYDPIAQWTGIGVALGIAFGIAIGSAIGAAQSRKKDQ